MPRAVRFAYYCSGHGYGHATRVSAFASSLLSLDAKPVIYVVSSAPPHVFSECMNQGAQYRNADVDPVIVQPLAYKVDRQKSLEVLQTFLSQKEKKLEIEAEWLSSERIDCVISDAAFLACEAATKAHIPSILVTNFTFDSVYSYLGTEMVDSSPNLSNDYFRVSENVQDRVQDYPIPEDVLAPLVSQLLRGYQHADVLLLLPGFIPIPSFFRSVTLPAPAWIDPRTNRFKPDIETVLRELPTSALALSPSIPFPDGASKAADGIGRPRVTYAYERKPPRTFQIAPLLVRPISKDINSSRGRSRLLSSIGIPDNLHDPDRTKILVVSFGGQKIRGPQGGKSPARLPPPSLDPDSRVDNLANSAPDRHCEDIHFTNETSKSNPTQSRPTSTKLFIPGAPAPINSPVSPDSPQLYLHGTDAVNDETISPLSSSIQDEPSLLPSPSWIAIVCGQSSNWSVSGADEAWPAGFYLAPPNVYMPDLTAVADVLMGKLGYGTVSECVAQCTPLIYVPRPLFVEEHGLRLFLEAEGIGIELSRDEYEFGNWANKVERAYMISKERGRVHQGSASNDNKVKELASWVVKRVEEWMH